MAPRPDDGKIPGWITPVLVTHEGGAAFMADGLARTSEETGVLAVVPAPTDADPDLVHVFLDRHLLGLLRLEVLSVTGHSD